MNLEQYLNWLADRYAGYFDVERESVILGHSLSIYAFSNIRCDKYFATKKISLGGYENIEHCLVAGHRQQVDSNGFEAFIHLLVKAANELVTPHHEHMSTMITGVLVSEKGFVPEIINQSKRFSFGRTYRFGLQGWSQVHLILVDLAAGQIHANKKGREVARSYLMPPSVKTVGR
ncbi:hypothetical protein SAMN05660649_02509 [Desulfotomaculum arcticum]|uniref:DUF8052 domain-containing protein n=1 Tax=Desulfotruncus arcticus DSM 17038 TaxID=1121424 RepID=A0A1I2U566_9FIRM|nr:hypothetical protein [Desulfotruncus arcticus]SFG72260.1 hypothetical protein SAMN05660649_02509 [Desulfotomaculum arcticum] [Desulfotruncus arcticus DSM 17038]